jgi:transcriptional regulator with XRE-family HTH domain
MTPKEWRVKEGLTLEEIAEEGGYDSTSYISEVENGQKEPSLRLARVYHKLSKGKVNLMTVNQ